MKHQRQYVVFGLSFLPAMAALTLIQLAIPSFVQVLEAFEAPLPPYTAFLIHYTWVPSLLPFLFLVAWFGWPNRKDRGAIAFTVSFLLSVAVVAFSFWSVYKPIFDLGQQAVQNGQADSEQPASPEVR